MSKKKPEMNAHLFKPLPTTKTNAAPRLRRGLGA
ncbi:protein of unknown function [Thermococcus camini]|uniref:Uncharacterized protein n=1 Tax=Thermococcus camini TaxID=2016373 RepID=A0A7G2D6V9_9EURY|nr:protein of unknown function [Thermococcus camini]